MNLMTILKGRGTYMVVVALFVLGGLRTLGVVTEEQYMSLLTWLAPSGLFFLRRAQGE